MAGKTKVEPLKIHAGHQPLGNIDYIEGVDTLVRIFYKRKPLTCTGRLLINAARAGSLLALTAVLSDVHKSSWYGMQFNPTLDPAELLESCIALDRMDVQLRGALSVLHQDELGKRTFEKANKLVRLYDDMPVVSRRVAKMLGSLEAAWLRFCGNREEALLPKHVAIPFGFCTHDQPAASQICMRPVLHSLRIDTHVLRPDGLASTGSGTCCWLTPPPEPTDHLFYEFAGTANGCYGEPFQNTDEDRRWLNDNIRCGDYFKEDKEEKNMDSKVAHKTLLTNRVYSECANSTKHQGETPAQKMLRVLSHVLRMRDGRRRIVEELPDDFFSAQYDYAGYFLYIKRLTPEQAAKDHRKRIFNQCMEKVSRQHSGIAVGMEDNLRNVDKEETLEKAAAIVQHELKIDDEAERRITAKLHARWPDWTINVEQRRNLQYIQCVAKAQVTSLQNRCAGIIAKCFPLGFGFPNELFDIVASMLWSL